MARVPRFMLVGCFGAAVTGGVGGCVLAWWWLEHTNWKGVPPRQFTLLNDLTVEAVVARVRPSPGPSARLRPGDRVTLLSPIPRMSGSRSCPTVAVR